MANLSLTTLVELALLTDATMAIGVRVPSLSTHPVEEQLEILRQIHVPPRESSRQHLSFSRRASLSGQEFDRETWQPFHLERVPEMDEDVETTVKPGARKLYEECDLDESKCTPCGASSIKHKLRLGTRRLLVSKADVQKVLQRLRLEVGTLGQRCVRNKSTSVGGVQEDTIRAREATLAAIERAHQSIAPFVLPGSMSSSSISNVFEQLRRDLDGQAPAQLPRSQHGI
ncbi:hypothetical protein IE81DRAFT_345752 [Ceraceosorus guamensis]|uniref:Uncharacterized protein n=1 Tax=Ceraceosorus guamensis TaxID=1522189 RepID=A0A316W6A9_9BASI|nr:hypothetical protein IE81DRAFT_345752 [Ceraceosorus guamensis]PWN44281.1 hypothetical protein IE81DRAFT_345752 [Ceraceosorus guamensis]